MNKAVFLDRDGVINEERGTYTFNVDDFQIIKGVPEAIRLLKEENFKVIVITNQSGISQRLYTKEMMDRCHEKMQLECDNLIDDIYYAMWHPDISESLFRKPDSLMLERAMAKYGIDPSISWIVGDKERDIESGLKVGLQTILVKKKDVITSAKFTSSNLLEAVRNFIL